jgi:DNA-directed RNA polymerase specialized sigma24 family protein
MGDPARFRTVFETTYGPVRRYVHRRGVTGGWADDVVAETFLIAWRRLDDVPVDDPLPWLLAVARNVWLDQRRRPRASPSCTAAALGRAGETIRRRRTERLREPTHQGGER